MKIGCTFLAWMKLQGENVKKREERKLSLGHVNFRGPLKQKE